MTMTPPTPTELEEFCDNIEALWSSYVENRDIEDMCLLYDKILRLLPRVRAQLAQPAAPFDVEQWIQEHSCNFADVYGNTTYRSIPTEHVRALIATLTAPKPQQRDIHRKMSPEEREAFDKAKAQAVEAYRGSLEYLAAKSDAPKPAPGDFDLEAWLGEHVMKGTEVLNHYDREKWWIGESDVRALAAHLRASPPAGEWVSVAERLPEKSQTVLCVVQSSRSDERFVNALEYRSYDATFDSILIRQSLAAVTHWQPLPPLPPAGRSGEEGA